jgi:hypothetical protein
MFLLSFLFQVRPEAFASLLRFQAGPSLDGAIEACQRLPHGGQVYGVLLWLSFHGVQIRAI